MFDISELQHVLFALWRSHLWVLTYVLQFSNHSGFSFFELQLPREIFVILSAESDIAT